MVKKIAKKSEAKKKIVVAPVEKPKAPTEVERTIGALVSMQASEGWAIMLKILNENIAYLENAIISKVDPTTEESLSDKEIEELRTKRELNIDLRDTPKKFTQQIEDTGLIPEEFDPYYKSMKDVDKDSRTPPPDDRG